MRELIRKILKEDLEYSHVTDASPDSDEYEMSEGWVGLPKKEELSPQVKEFLFDYWGKNGTELTPCRYIGIDCLQHAEDIDRLKIKFYGGYDKAFELAKKEIGIGDTVHVSDGGYEFDMTPLSMDIVRENNINSDENPHDVEIDVNVHISDGSVELLYNDSDYKWDFSDLFHRDNDMDGDTLHEIVIEINGACKEYFYPILDKYGLILGNVNNNYKFSWIK